MLVLVLITFVLLSTQGVLGIASATNASSSAFGASANLTLDPPLVGEIDIILAPTPEANGSAPPDYDESNSTA